MTPVWPGGARCAACFIFDLDAEYVFLGANPDVTWMPRFLSFYPCKVMRLFVAMILSCSGRPNFICEKKATACL